MKRSNLLPDEIVDWANTRSRAELRDLLARAILQRIAKIGLAFDPKNLAADIEMHDTLYFAAQEAGREDEATREFKNARLLAAQESLLNGEEEDAIYEFYHSLGGSAPNILFDAVKETNQPSQPTPRSGVAES